MIYERPDDFLAHYGVKGMRRGVRKQRVLKGRRQKTAYDKWKRNTKVRLALTAGAAAYGIGVLNGKVPPASLVARATYNSGKKAFARALAKQAAKPVYVKSTIRKLV